MAKKPAPSSPQGIDASHIKAKGWHRHANPASIVLLGLLLAAAGVGVFGGQPHPARTVTTPSANITLELPERIRNGMLFEMRGLVETKRPFSDLTIAISSSYWRDLTINSMVPGPAEESSENGRYYFSYGPIDANETLNVKIDGQINPPLFGGTKGDILLMDGDTVVATIPVKMTVFP
jgi:hypothetical protein